MQLYPQFTREYILNQLSLEEAIVFYNEGIRNKQEIASLEAVKMFGIPSLLSGGANIPTDSEITENMDGDSIIRYYESRKFDLNSFSDLMIGGSP